MPLLDVRNVIKRFGGVLANDKVSLHVGDNEIIGLIGPNGSGKTTLFNSVVGQHALDAGSVIFGGRNITGLGVQQIARLGVLRTFQHTRVYRSMTCLENVRFSLPHRNLTLGNLPKGFSPATVAHAREVLDFVGLYESRDQPAGELSFGQQRLLELAMTLMNGPKLLLLDEPTAGINPTAIAALIQFLRRVRAEFAVTLLIIEHNIPVIMDLADRIYCLNRGQVLAEGTPQQIKVHQGVIDAYLGAR